MNFHIGRFQEIENDDFYRDNALLNLTYCDNMLYFMEDEMLDCVWFHKTDTTQFIKQVLRAVEQRKGQWTVKNFSEDFLQAKALLARKLLNPNCVNIAYL